MARKEARGAPKSIRSASSCERTIWPISSSDLKRQSGEEIQHNSLRTQSSVESRNCAPTAARRLDVGGPELTRFRRARAWRGRSSPKRRRLAGSSGKELATGVDWKWEWKSEWKLESELESKSESELRLELGLELGLELELGFGVELEWECI